MEDNNQARKGCPYRFGSLGIQAGFAERGRFTPIRFIRESPLHLSKPPQAKICFEGEVNMMTRFERARILGARTLQLSLGAPPLVQSEEVDPLKIAQKEMELGVIPLAVKRT
jgi:DNA-directed RNA polymerase subunit K